MQLGADVLASGGSGTVGMEGTNGKLAGHPNLAAGAAKALLLRLLRQLEGTESQRAVEFLVGMLRQLTKRDAAAQRPFAQRLGIDAVRLVAGVEVIRHGADGGGTSMRDAFRLFF